MNKFKVVDLIKNIKRMNEMVDKLEEMDEDCEVLFGYDEGGYCVGGEEILNLKIDINIDNEDEYYKNGIVCVDVEVEKSED